MLMSTNRGCEEFEMSGGALCLDFANTLGDRPRADNEHLGDYEDLVRFGRQAHALPAAELDEVEAMSEAHPRAARAAFRRAIDLRESLYRIFSRLAFGKAPEAEDLQILNSVLHEALSELRLQVQDGSLEWVWDSSVPSLDRPIWPIARSAAELLTSAEAGLVRECASETCSWLFIDRSRTKRRRWCDMSTCGNRAKARRHYQRRKQGQSPS